MSMDFGIIASLLVFFIGLVGGLQICWVLLASSVVGLFVSGSSISFIVGTFYYAIDNYILMAIVFFIFAGSLMSSAGLADHIVKFSYSLVGNIRGGMIVVGIVATLFLSALTGSSVPCISALIPLLVPRLEKLGYQRRYTTAVLCSSSFLGYLIPPSIPVLLYCLLAGQSVAAVFLSTVVPGLMLAGGYIILNYFICPKYMDDTHNILGNDLNLSSISRLKMIFSTGVKAVPALGLPLLILIGIYGGIFTPNEAGAVAVIYTLFIGLIIYRRLNIKNIKFCTKSALTTTGMTVALIGTGSIFARFLIRAGVAQKFAAGFLSISNEEIFILFSLNILLLIFGMFFDGTAIMIIGVPLILPLISELDINFVQLGAIIVVNVGLGVVTPPYAMSIFVGSKLSGVPYNELVKPMLLYLFFVGLPVLFLTTYIPALSCWLPTLILGLKAVGSW